MTGLEAATYFKYYQQYKFSYIVDKLPLRRIQAKSLYTKYKKYFDSLSVIFQKYSIDIPKYLKFFVLDYCKQEKDIKEYLLNIQSINNFIDSVKAEEKKEKICGWYLKSIRNIIKDCISLGFLNTKDYIRYLIKTRKLAAYYSSGKISKYWFSGIPGFRKVIDQLDQLSKDEFNDIYKNFEIYSTEINDALLCKKKYKANPLKQTDEMLFLVRNKSCKAV